MSERPFWQSSLMAIGHYVFLIGFVALLDWLFDMRTDKTGFAIVIAVVALRRTYQWRPRGEA